MTNPKNDKSPKDAEAEGDVRSSEADAQEQTPKSQAEFMAEFDRLNAITGQEYEQEFMTGFDRLNAVTGQEYERR